MVVDDQVYNIDAILSLLHFKYKLNLDFVDRAENGQMAYDQFMADFFQNQGISSYGLILMDCNMPFMDGYTACNKIRNFLHEKANLGIRAQPVISAVTGQTEKIYVRQCIISGMN